MIHSFTSENGIQDDPFLQKVFFLSQIIVNSLTR